MDIWARLAREGRLPGMLALRRRSLLASALMQDCLSALMAWHLVVSPLLLEASGIARGAPGIRFIPLLSTAAAQDVTYHASYAGSQQADLEAEQGSCGKPRCLLEDRPARLRLPKPGRGTVAGRWAAHAHGGEC